jgi:hypothetical protein
MSRLKRAVDALIYASVFLGMLLLYEVSGLVPGWLLASLFGGEFAYAAASLLVAKKYTWAYYLVFILAVVVLAVSLPQPQHYQFAETGQLVQFFTFAAGSVLQICLIVLIPVYLWQNRRAKRQ